MSVPSIGRIPRPANRKTDFHKFFFSFSKIQKDVKKKLNNNKQQMFLVVAGCRCGCGCVYCDPTYLQL